MAKSLCSGGGIIIFALLTEVVTGFVVIIPINIGKIYLKERFRRVFYSYEFNFYYYLNNILYVFIYINPCKGFRACKSY